MSVGFAPDTFSRSAAHATCYLLVSPWSKISFKFSGSKSASVLPKRRLFTNALAVSTEVRQGIFRSTAIRLHFKSVRSLGGVRPLVGVLMISFTSSLSSRSSMLGWGLLPSRIYRAGCHKVKVEHSVPCPVWRRCQIPDSLSIAADWAHISCLVVIRR